MTPSPLSPRGPGSPRDEVEEALLIAKLDLRARFAAEGRQRWSEADEHGAVTVHRVADDTP